MEENYSESYESLLNQINEILIRSSKLNNNEERVEFLKQNEAIFAMFKSNIDEIANEYLVKKIDNSEQNKMSNLLKTIIIGLLNNEEVFDTQKDSEEYKTIIIEMLSHYENRLMFRLRHSDELDLILQCLEYQKDREAYIRAIKNNKIIEKNYFTERAIRNYINDSYERIMFENMIRIIKDDNIMINKRKIKKLIKQIDTVEFISRILRKDEVKMQTIEKWILQKYADTIIPLKVSAYPEGLESDILVIAFLNGKIKNEKLYLEISNAIPIDEFESLIFAINLKNTNRIIKEIKLGNLSEQEKSELDALLEKAGIKVSKKEKIEDDENYLVTIQELKEYYEETKTEDIYNEKAKFYKANIKENNGEGELSSTEKKIYLEISIIIKMMTKKMRENISPKFIEFIERNKAKAKRTEIDRTKKLKGQKIKTETKTLLALIYRDYMCSEDERKQLIKDERIEMTKKEAEQQEKSLALIKELKWHQKVLKLIKKAINKRNNI